MAACTWSLLQDEAQNQKRQLEALFVKDTADAFCVFDSMEHFLCQPEYLRGQLQVQLDEPTQVDGHPYTHSNALDFETEEVNVL